MATKFLETPDATQGTQFWSSITGSVTYDTTAGRMPSGLASWKCDSGAGSTAYLARDGAFSQVANGGFRVSFYLYLTTLPAGLPDTILSGSGAVRIDSSGVLSLYWYSVLDTGSTLSLNTLYRICLVGKLNASSQITDLKVFLNGAEDMSATGLTLTSGANLCIGWFSTPGENKILNFSHVYADDDSSLTDTGDMRVTAKLPDEVNNNAYDTTGGTGAVNERPISETNYKSHEAKSEVLQDYTLETAAEGDVNISGDTLVARCAWMWAMSSKDGDTVCLVDNGDSSTCWPDIDGVAQLCSKITDSAVYPSNAAGIGQKSGAAAPDEYLYECGTIIAYVVAAGGQDGTLNAALATASSESMIAGLTAGALFSASLGTATLLAYDAASMAGGTGATMSAVLATATADGFSAQAFTGGAQLAALLSTASAEGLDAASFTGGALFSASLSTATASGFDATFSIIATMLAALAEASASSFNATATGGALLSAVLSTANAQAFKVASFTGGAQLSGILATAIADSLSAQSFTGGALLSALLAEATAQGYDAGLGVDVTLSAALATATTQSFASTLTGAALLSAVLATATASGYNSGFTGGANLAASLATASLLSPNAVLQSNAELAAALATAEALAYSAASFTGGAQLVAAFLSATGQAFDADFQVGQSGTLWAALAQATTAAWNALATGNALFSGVLSSGSASALASVLTAGATLAGVLSTATAQSYAGALTGGATLSALLAEANASVLAMTPSGGAVLAGMLPAGSALAFAAELTAGTSATLWAELAGATILAYDPTMHGWALFTVPVATAEMEAPVAVFSVIEGEDRRSIYRYVKD